MMETNELEEARLDSMKSIFEKAAELEEAHRYLDESNVNDPDNDDAQTLVERIALIVEELTKVRAELKVYQRRSALRQ